MIYYKYKNWLCQIFLEKLDDCVKNKIIILFYLWNTFISFCITLVLNMKNINKCKLFFGLFSYNIYKLFYNYLMSSQ